LSVPPEVGEPSPCLSIETETMGGNKRYIVNIVTVAGPGGGAPETIRPASRPGDRFRPLGAPGARKLQDFFVDRKVPRGERDTVPLVVDASDRIVWVVGQTVAEDFRVTDPSRGVILLKVRHLGGVG